MSSYAVIGINPADATTDDDLFFCGKWQKPDEIEPVEHDGLRFVKGKKSDTFSTKFSTMSKRCIVEPVEMWNVNGVLFPSQKDAEAYAFYNSDAVAKTKVMILGD